MDFGYPVPECDVRESERPRLEKFRERVSVWYEWLTEDQHSIWKQIHGMLWNDMVFRTINECRRLAQRSPLDSVDFNRAVASFVDEGYVAKQLLAIRRLTEANVQGGAITLPRLLDDMKTNADLFTREMYVCYDGLPFDPEPAQQRRLRKLASELNANNGVAYTRFVTRGPEASDTAILAHESFDRLTGASGKHWSRDDKLDPAIFGKVKSKLGCCSGINKVASKFIAHAADLASRGMLNDKERRITLDRIEVCQRIICRVAAYIHGPLLYFGGSGLIPTPQFDHLEHFEKGWIDPANIGVLARYWESRAAKVENWLDGGPAKLLNLPG